MAVSTTLFTTGPATLPDVGQVTYNGCTFSPLFATDVKGVMVKDSAGRTTKFMKYTITVDGYVTLSPQLLNIAPTMDGLRLLLSQQGAAFTYKGRGLDIVTSPAVRTGTLNATATDIDVAWGPIPRVLEFQPLGAGLSAKIKWEVELSVPEVKYITLPGKGFAPPTPAGRTPLPRMLEFNYDVSVTYEEDGYSTITCTGVLEVPMTRRPTKDSRPLYFTADDYRPLVEQRLMSSIDLGRFIVTKRNFKTSKDKRTLEWTFEFEEKRYMDLPPYCTVARGSFTVRQARQGIGNVQWLCTLKATYTLRKDAPRRMAWVAFLMLLRLRMACSVLANIPVKKKNRQNPNDHNLVNFDLFGKNFRALPTGPTGWIENATDNLKGLFNVAGALESDNDGKAGGELGAGGVGEGVGGAVANTGKVSSRNCQIMDFNLEEGLYKDSGNVTFSCTWRVITTQSHILLASGLWIKLPEKDDKGNNLWATSVKDIMGSESWLTNRLDPALDVIVDFGGP